MEKVDLILKNVNYLNPETNSFVKGDIAIKDGIIVGINGEYEGMVNDLDGKYIVPSFVDGHIHIESTNSTPKTFSKIVAMHGTLDVIADFHEIINVGGMDACKYVLNNSKNLPVNIHHAVASSVPASKFDMHSVTFGSIEIDNAFSNYDDQTIALGEVIDFASLKESDIRLFEEIDSAKRHGKILNGHAPSVRGEDFKTYLKLSHVTDDHECFSYEEALEKLSIADTLALEELNDVIPTINNPEILKELQGLDKHELLRVAEKYGLIKRFRIMIRDGGAAKNLKALSPLFNHPEYLDRLLFVTDDKEIEELKEKGHIDSIIEKAISFGVNPIDAYNAASINEANYYGLKDIGSIEVGKKANLVVLDNPLGMNHKTIILDNEVCPDISILGVYKEGILLTNKILDEWEDYWSTRSISEQEEKLLIDGKMTHTMHFTSNVDLDTVSNYDNARTIIEVVPNELLTNNYGVTKDYDLENDILKLVVMDCHNGTMKHQVCFVKGIGLKEGAYCGTIAHDSHYMIAVGTNDNDLVKAMNTVIEMQGGQAYVNNGEVLASLKLEIAGLMTNSPIEDIKISRESLKKIKCNPGINVTITTQFLSLCVIPSIRMTPEGIVNVLENRLITQEEMNNEFQNRNLK